jgi:anti-anti-sigma factor
MITIPRANLPQWERPIPARTLPAMFWLLCCNIAHHYHEEAMPLSLKSRFCGNVHIIQCHGRIVAGDEVKSLEAALEMASHEVPRIVLNMSDVERVDSIGIGLLVRFATRVRKRGGDIRLAAPQQFVVTLLKLTMLSSVLHVYSTEDAAILSFLDRPLDQKAPGNSGPRVLVLDQSADLCSFVKTVLMQHGFEVKSASYFQDARILLQVDHVDYIVVGPDSAQFCYETILGALKALAPKATALQLAADFKSRDALEASDALLQLFGAQQQFANSKSPA